MIEAIRVVLRAPAGMLESHRRHWNMVWPRQVAALALTDRIGLGWSEAGRLLNRTHGAIISAARQCRNVIETEPELKRQYEEILRRSFLPDGADMDGMDGMDGHGSRTRTRDEKEGEAEVERKGVV